MHTKQYRDLSSEELSNKLECWEKVNEDDNWWYLERYHRKIPSDRWEKQAGLVMRLKEPLWVTWSIQEIFRSHGIEVDKRRAEEFEHLNSESGGLDGIYYAIAACEDGTDEALKLIMGPIAAYLNRTGLRLQDMPRILPGHYLAGYVAAIKDGRLDRGYAKESLAYLLERGTRFVDPFTHHVDALMELDQEQESTWILWLEWLDQQLDTNLSIRMQTPEEVIAEIAGDPRFKAADASEVDGIIDAVLASNAEQAAKVQENPKLLQWFVGQVMKAGKGKAPATTVQEKLKQRFRVA
jgi:Asp-tRNA(Asn)/Glu-tRNA(Gln) amidotransferase B subunit